MVRGEEGTFRAVRGDWRAARGTRVAPGNKDKWSAFKLVPLIFKNSFNSFQVGYSTCPRLDLLNLITSRRTEKDFASYFYGFILLDRF